MLDAFSWGEVEDISDVLSWGGNVVHVPKEQPGVVGANAEVGIGNHRLFGDPIDLVHRLFGLES